jgi:trimethylamine:corrinoid methyltransferase-like protein
VRSAQWRPTIINRQGYPEWQAEGGLDLAEKARRKARRLLDEHEPRPLDAGVAAAIDAVVAGFTPTVR